MKVSKAIEYLSEYKPDDEIFIAWWDKSCTDTSNDIWERAVELVEDQEYWSSAASESLMDCIAEAEKEIA